MLQWLFLLALRLDFWDWIGSVILVILILWRNACDSAKYEPNYFIHPCFDSLHNRMLVCCIISTSCPVLSPLCMFMVCLVLFPWSVEMLLYLFYFGLDCLYVGKNDLVVLQSQFDGAKL